MICRWCSACSVNRECILDLHHSENRLEPAEISKKISHFTVLGPGLCLLIETEVYVYQLLIEKLSNLLLPSSLAQEHKLQCLSHFLLMFFWMFLWVMSEWVTRATDNCITQKRKRKFSLFCLCEDSVCLKTDHTEYLFEKDLIFFPIYTSYTSNFTSFFPPLLFWLLLVWFADLWVVLSEVRWYESTFLLLFSWRTALSLWFT